MSITTSGSTQATIAPIPEENTLPCYASFLFGALHKAHSLVKCCNRAQNITRNASQFGLFIGGAMLNYCCGNNPCISIPARFTLVTRKLIDCIKQQEAFYQACQKSERAFTKAAPSDPLKRLDFATWSCCSSSTKSCVETFLNQILDRIVKISVGIFRFFVELFKLSMSYMDLSDAFSEDAQDESVQDCFMNCNSIYEDLIKHEKQVHETLEYIGAQYNFQPVTSCLSATVSCATSACGAAAYGVSKAVEFFRWSFGLQTEEGSTNTPSLAFNSKHAGKPPPSLSAYRFQEIV